MTTTERLRETLNRLDTEEDLQVRADLIDHAIGYANIDPQAAEEWEAYR